MSSTTGPHPLAWRTAATRRVRLGLTWANVVARGATLDARHAVRRRLGLVRPVLDGVAQTEEDPSGPNVLADPAGWFERLHAAGPVNYHAASGIWIINGYDAVRAAARAHEALSSGEGSARFRTNKLRMLVTMDRPEHARLRRIVARDFTNARALELADVVRELTVDGIERILAAGNSGADAYASLAAPVPLELTAGLLGVPLADRPTLRRWSDAIVSMVMVDIRLRERRRLGAFLNVIVELFEYFEALILERRRRPGHDALTRLLNFEDDEGPLTTEELLWFIVLLLVAGNETTTSVTMALLYSLASDPEQYQLLRTRPELIPQAVEEGIRWATPASASFRTAAMDYEVTGGVIPAGSRVMLHYAAGNRDPGRFADPNRFDIGRELTEHVGFGSGIHFCLGSHLARLELTILLEELCSRVEHLELVGQPVWRRTDVLRGLKYLPIRFRNHSRVVADTN